MDRKQFKDDTHPKGLQKTSPKDNLGCSCQKKPYFYTNKEHERVMLFLNVRLASLETEVSVEKTAIYMFGVT